jgi:hypothetical protein
MCEKVIIVQIAVYCILCFSTLLVYTSTGTGHRYHLPVTGNYKLQQYITVCTTYDTIALVLQYSTVQNVTLSSIHYSKVYIA